MVQRAGPGFELPGPHISLQSVHAAGCVPAQLKHVQLTPRTQARHTKQDVLDHCRPGAVSVLRRTAGLAGESCSAAEDLNPVLIVGMSSTVAAQLMQPTLLALHQLC